MIADPLWSCVMLLCGTLWVFCGSSVGPLRSFAAFSHTRHFSEFYLQDGGKNQLARMWNKMTSLSPYILVLSGFIERSVWRGGQGRCGRPVPGLPELSRGAASRRLTDLRTTAFLARLQRVIHGSAWHAYRHCNK